ncbi:MAG TPA: TQO small subunit DoxD [Ktedonobacterales bacterium]|nr:TQO small subunit DoxD [Ktedonobacterales bacterium]
MRTPVSSRHDTQRSGSTIEDMKSRIRAGMTPAWVLAPLRLFFGITFIYAGLQKFTDPQFFKKSAPGYIGKQILAFAHGTPLHGFLLSVAEPHAVAFGVIVALGEIAIGLGTLTGILFRLAAIFGALLSLIFFLSASWRVYPYFYGADIVFVFGWITLILAQPAACGWPALDVYMLPWLRAHLPASQWPRFDRASALLLGVGAEPETQTAVIHDAPRTAARTATGSTARAGGRAPAARSRAGVAARRTASRREFLRGAATGGVGMLALAWLWSITHNTTAAAPGTPTTPAGTGAGASATTTTGAGATGGATATGNAIAQASQVGTNNSASFTIPSNGDPGVLVHLSNGKFVAFDATCTHQGCPVNYDPSSQLLLCPCHGAAFDPAQGAAVVQGPAPTPLAPVAINVDNSTGAITLAS